MMPHGSIASGEGGAEACQDRLLPLVSRTFALTIPQLPSSLRPVVANAYLLCRAADTIEDDTALDAEQKRRYEDALVDVVSGRSDAAKLAAEITPLLSPQTPPAERELLRQLPQVIALTRSIAARPRAAVERCLRIMGRGMHHFQRGASIRGLAALEDVDRYCYVVGGVVGEMLTDLFCDYSAAIARQRDSLLKLAISFGQGLQMTNILKDQWEDRARGVCWLPRDLFARHGVDLTGVASGQTAGACHAARRELIGAAHAHLRNALAYTLLVPASEPGVRRFCYWAIHLAALTLRNIHRTPCFTAGAQVKVSRRCVAEMILLTPFVQRSDLLLRLWFDRAARGLPLRPLPPDWAPVFSLDQPFNPAVS